MRTHSAYPMSKPVKRLGLKWIPDRFGGCMRR
jgi:hypothetical protein